MINDRKNHKPITENRQLKKMQNKNNIIDYWLESADHDLDTAQGLFDISKYD